MTKTITDILGGEKSLNKIAGKGPNIVFTVQLKPHGGFTAGPNFVQAIGDGMITCLIGHGEDGKIGMGDALDKPELAVVPQDAVALCVLHIAERGKAKADCVEAQIVHLQPMGDKKKTELSGFALRTAKRQTAGGFFKKNDQHWQMLLAGMDCAER